MKSFKQYLTEQLLLEYNREATLTKNKKLTQALVNQFKNDKSPIYENPIRDARSGNMSDEETVNFILDRIEGKTPQTNNKPVNLKGPDNIKSYLIWLLEKYAYQDKNENKRIDLEDLIGKSIQRIRAFDKWKKKNVPLDGVSKNINEYKSYYNFLDIVDKKIQPETEEQSKLKIYGEKIDEKAAEKEGIDLLTKNEQEKHGVRIVHTTTKRSNKFYGQNTEWCTRHPEEEYNYFNGYNEDGFLFVLIPKNPKYDHEKYQVHFESEQYMNINDEPVDRENLLTKKYGNLVPYFERYYAKNKKQLPIPLLVLTKKPDDLTLDEKISIIKRIMNKSTGESSEYDNYADMLKKSFSSEDFIHILKNEMISSALHIMYSPDTINDTFLTLKDYFKKKDKTYETVSTYVILLLLSSERYIDEFSKYLNNLRYQADNPNSYFSWCMKHVTKAITITKTSKTKLEFMKELTDINPDNADLFRYISYKVLEAHILLKSKYSIIELLFDSGNKIPASLLITLPGSIIDHIVFHYSDVYSRTENQLDTFLDFLKTYSSQLMSKENINRDRNIRTFKELYLYGGDDVKKDFPEIYEIVGKILKKFNTPRNDTA